MDVVVVDSAIDDLRRMADRSPDGVVRLLDDVDAAVASGNLANSRLAVAVGTTARAKAFLVGQGKLRALLTVYPANPDQVVVANVFDVEVDDAVQSPSPPGGQTITSGVH